MFTFILLVLTADPEKEIPILDMKAPEKDNSIKLGDVPINHKTQRVGTCRTDCEGSCNKCDQKISVLPDKIKKVVKTDIKEKKVKDCEKTEGKEKLNEAKKEAKEKGENMEIRNLKSIKKLKK